ncbi:MAG: ATP-dependent 6-phosphofructokinase [Vicinamibacterales bacterium]|jgi:6-phosphofructokinase 1|nr:6-phosphofructokinase [Acidobacteriota bacterium]MDP6373980.1 ATP-dependent 6-phosphofructokinase [Vicinamibacterales bacterium]MDP6609442.1 ATP-dependent 6-phosphofructokinase [Vicinamibacterales bacterium]|tara:strand:+ start:1402 stop:2484 length:1083 start_codon:yes stop_codon:yes gene_type:complete
MPDVKRVGVMTGGGDAPGLNAVIRAVVKSAAGFGYECIGFEDSFDGLIDPSRSRTLTRDDVAGIVRIGGTILGTTNRGDPFSYPGQDGAEVRDRSTRCVQTVREFGLKGLVVIGGDGTLTIAERFHRLGMPIVGVPKTIDNDIVGTNSCFGFDTAVAFATEAIDRLHTTAASHRRVMVVEVMGRYAGWIALYAGLAGGADAILIPEIPFNLERVAACVRERERFGARFSIVVVAEGAAPIGGTVSVVEQAQAGRLERLGGVGSWVAEQLEGLTGKESRSVVLGHLQRGGAPTAFDRVLATRFGGKAMELVNHGTFGMMVANRPPELVAVPLAEMVGKTKQVPLDLDLVKTARAIGISFGD